MLAANPLQLVGKRVVRLQQAARSDHVPPPAKRTTLLSPHIKQIDRNLDCTSRERHLNMADTVERAAGQCSEVREQARLVRVGEGEDGVLLVSLFVRIGRSSHRPHS